MQRYFLNSPPLTEELFVLDDESAHHVVKVMRMKIGEAIIVVSEKIAYVCTIEEISNQVVVKKTGETIPSPEMPIEVTIACGLPKGDKLELIAQKGTELGMTKLIPYTAERSIVKWDDKKAKKNIERLQKIAKEAAEQSHRVVVPSVNLLVTSNQLTEMFSQYDVIFVADEEAAKNDYRESFSEKLQQVKHSGAHSILCIFGPEGGISRKESEMYFQAGAKTIALGPRILRAETAPLYALSAISYEFE